MADKLNLLSVIRELSYDKFPVHALTINALSERRFNLNKNTLLITNTSNPPLTLTNIDLTTGTQKFSDVFEALVTNGYQTGVTGSFRGDESLDELLNYVDLSMDLPIKIYTKKFYSDFTILEFIKLYLIKCLGYSETITETDIDTVITQISGDAERHLVLYVAITLVDFRRLAAYATSVFTGNFFNDGSGKDMSGDIQKIDDNITVNIGDVFTLNDNDNKNETFLESDRGVNPGDENFFADFNGFWYRLFLWLRDRLEQQFGDYTFRKNNGIWTRSELDKPLSYLQYYDSYPYPSQAQGIYRNLLSDPSV